MNKVVYAQLSVPTTDRSAHHLVKCYSKTKYGYAAWIVLITWFDRDTITNDETSEYLRSKLGHLILHQAVTTSQCINKFLTWNNDLSQIEGESFSRAQTVYLFLKNIVEDEYSGTITYLTNVDTDLDSGVVSIRKKGK